MFVHFVTCRWLLIARDAAIKRRLVRASSVCQSCSLLEGDGSNLDRQPCRCTRGLRIDGAKGVERQSKPLRPLFFFLPPWVRWWQVQVTAISPADLSVPHERHPLCCPLAFRRALSDCVVLRRGCMPPRRRPRGRRHGFASAAASQKTLTHSYLLRGRGRGRKQPCRFAGLRSMTQRSNEVSPLSLPNGVEAVA